jgi:hypothetical protein
MIAGFELLLGFGKFFIQSVQICEVTDTDQYLFKITLLITDSLNVLRYMYDGTILAFEDSFLVITMAMLGNFCHAGTEDIQVSEICGDLRAEQFICLITYQPAKRGIDVSNIQLGIDGKHTIRRVIQYLF